MPRLRLIRPGNISIPHTDAVEAIHADDSPRALPFSGRLHLSSDPMSGSVDQLLEAMDSMSRRIDDLARELDCLGFFDDDDDRPRAA